MPGPSYQQLQYQKLMRAKQSANPANPTNPSGGALDPRNALPEYPRDGNSKWLETSLVEVSDDYRTAVDTLTQRLDDVADEFAEAFEVEDKRRATRARIQNTASPERERLQRERNARIG